MNANKVIFLLVALVASALAAPTETPAGQASTETSTSSATITTTAAPTTTSAAPTTTSATQTTTTAAPTTTSAPSTEPSATSPMVNASTFTCYGRPIGYYADPEQDCKVYHFCLLGEYNNEPVYQRISYLCLNNTVFDQQALDCVESAKVSAPCKDSLQYYDVSNHILRQSIVGKKSQSDTLQSNQNETTTTA